MRIRFSLAVCLVFLSACQLAFGPTHAGSGTMATEPRTTPFFDEIESQGSIDIVVHVGQENSVEVSGDDNLLEYVQTEVRGGTLKVSLENGSYNLDQPMLVTVTCPSLKELSMLGSGDARITGLDEASLTLEVQGSGDVSAKGKVDELDVSVRGSGDLELRNLLAKVVTAGVQGSGDISVHAEEKLRASVHGSGDIDYWGSPKDRDVESHGSGSVKGH